MECIYCKGFCIKKGCYKGVQKYKCKSCFRGHRAVYRTQKYSVQTDNQILRLNREGVGISSISRIMCIPKTTVLRRILSLSTRTRRPTITEKAQVYEMDELYTYVGKKCNPCYVIYAINKRTRQVIDFVCGSRTRENINKVIESLLVRSPKRIYTDGLNVYQHLIPKRIHATLPYRTNRIERKNLTLRTHLKRLSRKTICYSKSQAMLEACFRLYAWSKMPTAGRK